MGSIPRYRLRKKAASVNPASRQKAKPEPAASAKKSRHTRASLGRLLANWNRVAKRARSLPAGDRLVAWCLHDYVRMGNSVSAYLDTGKLQCWPSVERIADDIGVNRRTVQRALRRLEAIGLIRTRVARDGGNLTSHYYLLPQKRPSSVTHPEDKEPQFSRPDRGGLRAAALGLIGAASEAEEGRSGRRSNTLPSEGKEYARARKRDATPLKGAAASHRRADEDKLAGYFRRIEQLSSLPIEDDDDDDVYDILKRERDTLSKEDYLALIEDHRSQLSAGEYRSLKRRA